MPDPTTYADVRPMRTCKICGSVNEEGAARCSGCGVGFSDEVGLGKEGRAPRTVGVSALAMSVLKIVRPILLLAILLLIGRMYMRGVKSGSAALSAETPNGQMMQGDDPAGMSGAPVPRLEERKCESPHLPLDLPDDSREEVVRELGVTVQRMPPYDIGREFSDLSKWSVDWEGFLREHPGIRFRDDGRSRHSVLREYVLFHGYPLCDDVLVFSDDGLDSIEVSLFNMGDEKTLAAESAAVETVNAISEFIAAERVDVGQATDGGVKFVVTYDWVGSFPHLVMTMGVVTREGVRYAEYLNGTLTISGQRAVSNASGDPRKNVRRNRSDVYIDGIPMVNQGQRGYCVPATIERILRYYGVDADMHALALLLDTKVEGGTRMNAKQVDKIAQMAGLSHEEYRELERYDEEYCRRYNLAARDYGGRQLFIEDFTVEETDDDGRTVNMRHYDWLVEAMDEGLKRKSRLYDKVGYAAFRDGIVSSIEKGRPLVWSVDKLFSWDRSDGSLGGGHTRIIVGYNELHDEVLYSDSWGGGHEFKRASMKEAWENTDFLTCLFRSP